MKLHVILGWWKIYLFYNLICYWTVCLKIFLIVIWNKRCIWFKVEIFMPLIMCNLWYLLNFVSSQRMKCWFLVLYSWDCESFSFITMRIYWYSLNEIWLAYPCFQNIFHKFLQTLDDNLFINRFFFAMEGFI